MILMFAGEVAGMDIISEQARRAAGEDIFIGQSTDEILAAMNAAHTDMRRADVLVFCENTAPALPTGFRPGRRVLAILGVCEKAPDGWDAVFILSAKNERGVVNSGTYAAMQNTAGRLAALFMGTEGTDFLDALAERARQTGCAPLATAGCWVFSPVAESETSATNRLLRPLGEKIAAGPVNYHAPGISHLPARDVKPWQLWGKTIYEASELLFGDAALCSNAVAATKIRPRLRFNADHVVKQIDDAYTATKRAQMRTRVTALAAQLASLPVEDEQKPPETPGHAPLCAFLLRHDALAEAAVKGMGTDGLPYCLRLVGGFELRDIAE